MGVVLTLFDAISSVSTVSVAFDLTASFHTRRTVRGFTKIFWPDHQKCPWEEGLPSTALSTWQPLESSHCWSAPSFCSLGWSDHQVPAPWWLFLVAMQLIEDLAFAPVTENGGLTRAFQNSIHNVYMDLKLFMWFKRLCNLLVEISNNRNFYLGPYFWDNNNRVEGVCRCV